jgi:16S rRNA (adenine1518-N6/adenine1519-N6)-dimethyltransferase
LVANKRLGQHFLIDPNIVRKIVALAAIRPDETVLEIGPGRGALTRVLCERAARVIAIELDRDLATRLRETHADCGNLELHQGDALAYPYHSLPPRTVVVANLPYNVSSPILFALLEARDRFDRLILMLQTEVAQRLAARPGSKDYGVLSVLAQAMADIAVEFRVAPTCFQPPPDVSSSIVRLTIPRRVPIAIPDQAAFTRTVRAAFAHRRKTLVNSLRDEGYEHGTILPALDRAGLAPTIRAERLSIEELARLSTALNS